MKTYSIYRATNLITGKSYIGRTTSALNKRLSWHYSNAKKRQHKHNKFFDALLEFGVFDWEWDILETTNDKEKSYKLEEFYIQKYDAIENGYNTKPGDRTPWVKGKKMPEEFREKIRGKNNGMYGKTHSEEYRIWRSEHMSKIQLGKNNHTARKVYCIELDKTWDTVKEASTGLGINKDSISHNCRGVNKSAGGYHFKYVDDKEIHVNRDVNGSLNPRARKVFCIELNRQWDTLKDCAEEIGVTPQMISKVCRGERKTANNFHFKYI